MWVFKSLLKVWVHVSSRILIGRSLHSLAARTSRLRSPYVPFARGIVRTQGSSELPPRCVQAEERPQVRRTVLPVEHFVYHQQDRYSMRELTGSQCKSLKTGVMWSRLRHCFRSLAAAFCALCGGEMFTGLDLGHILCMKWTPDIPDERWRINAEHKNICLEKQLLLLQNLSQHCEQCLIVSEYLPPPG